MPAVSATSETNLRIGSSASRVPGNVRSCIREASGRTRNWRRRDPNLCPADSFAFASILARRFVDIFAVGDVDALVKAGLLESLDNGVLGLHKVDLQARLFLLGENQNAQTRRGHEIQLLDRQHKVRWRTAP